MPEATNCRNPAADAKGGASQFVAEQFKPDEKVARVGWGGIAGRPAPSPARSADTVLKCMTWAGTPAL
jgi:hypothetical protein